MMRWLRRHRGARRRHANTVTVQDRTYDVELPELGSTLTSHERIELEFHFRAMGTPLYLGFEPNAMDRVDMFRADAEKVVNLRARRGAAQLIAELEETLRTEER